MMSVSASNSGYVRSYFEAPCRYPPLYWRPACLAMPSLLSKDLFRNSDKKFSGFEVIIDQKSDAAAVRLHVENVKAKGGKSSVLWDTLDFSESGFTISFKEPVYYKAAHAWAYRTLQGTNVAWTGQPWAPSDHPQQSRPSQSAQQKSLPSQSAPATPESQKSQDRFSDKASSTMEPVLMGIFPMCPSQKLARGSHGCGRGRGSYVRILTFAGCTLKHNALQMHVCTYVRT